jgi:hypothetical protein
MARAGLEAGHGFRGLLGEKVEFLVVVLDRGLFLEQKHLAIDA